MGHLSHILCSKTCARVPPPNPVQALSTLPYTFTTCVKSNLTTKLPSNYPIAKQDFCTCFSSCLSQLSRSFPIQNFRTLLTLIKYCNLLVSKVLDFWIHSYHTVASSIFNHFSIPNFLFAHRPLPYLSVSSILPGFLFLRQSYILL